MRTSIVLLFCVFLSGCQSKIQPGVPPPPNVRRGGANGEPERLPEPSVRIVPDADRELLWTAAKDYMQKSFGDRLRGIDPEKRVIETKILEKTHEGIPYRTKVIMRVADDPADTKGAMLRIVALRSEPKIGFGEAQTGQPIPEVWIARGKDENIERIVADEVVRRYLLLRAGRNPDETPITEVPAGLRRDDAPQR